MLGHLVTEMKLLYDPLLILKMNIVIFCILLVSRAHTRQFISSALEK